MSKQWDVVICEQVTAWLDATDSITRQRTLEALLVLAREGPNCGRPLVDIVTASRHKNMKELRPGSSGRKKIRLLFAFDPQRSAIILLAGDKAGVWDKWYRKNIPLADDLFDEHLAGLGER